MKGMRVLRVPPYGDKLRTPSGLAVGRAGFTLKVLPEGVHSLPQDV